MGTKLQDELTSLANLKISQLDLNYLSLMKLTLITPAFPNIILGLLQQLCILRVTM